jgi:predicted Zn-dependent protease
VLTPVYCLASAAESDLGENEVSLGKEAAAQIVKEYKLIKDEDVIKRVNAIGARLSAVANKKEVQAGYGSPKITPFNYTFTVLDDPDVNAFCVPGGYVYVCKGLMDFIQSDHELAGVLAHEVTHASHHHMTFLLRKQAAANTQTAVALLAAMLGNVKGTNMSNLLLGMQLYQIARLNSWSREAENDADHGGVTYAHEAGYNPVGLLTFLERLARRPEATDLGIYRTHPVDAERITNVKALITGQGLPLNRRQTIRAGKAEVRIVTADTITFPEVVIYDSIILRPASIIGTSAQQRADETAARINKLLDSGVGQYEIKSNSMGIVSARGQSIVTITDADAKNTGKTIQQATKDAAAAIRQVIWREMLDTLH